MASKLPTFCFPLAACDNCACFNEVIHALDVGVAVIQEPILGVLPHDNSNPFQAQGNLLSIIRDGIEEVFTPLCKRCLPNVT